MTRTPPVHTGPTPGRAAARGREQARAVVSDPVDLAALEGTPPILVAGLAAVLSPYDARVRVHRPGHRADVLVADLSHQTGPLRVPVVASPLVVLVRDGDVAAHAQARAAGVDPVPISATADVLVRTVEATHRRGREPIVVTEAGSAAHTDLLGTALSPREVEVLEGICAGLSNVEIAQRLFVSINSVKTYIRSAYRKMGVERRGQAVVWGMQRGYGAQRPAGN